MLKEHVPKRQLPNSTLALRQSQERGQMDGGEQCARDLMCSGCSWTTSGPSGPASRLGQNVQSSQLLPNEEWCEPAHPMALGTALHQSQLVAMVRLRGLGCSKGRGEVGRHMLGLGSAPLSGLEDPVVPSASLAQQDSAYLLYVKKASAFM